MGADHLKNDFPSGLSDPIDVARWRREFEKLIAERGPLTLSAVRKAKPGLYRNMQQTDTVWLTTRCTPKDPNLKHKGREPDLAAKDLAHMRAISAVVDAQKDVVDGPRMTMSSICRRAGLHLGLLKQRHLLPLTSKLLSEASETLIAYYLRRASEYVKRNSGQGGISVLSLRQYMRTVSSKTNDLLSDDALKSFIEAADELPPI